MLRRCRLDLAALESDVRRPTMKKALPLLFCVALAAAVNFSRAQTAPTTAAVAPVARNDGSTALEKRDPSGKFQKMHASFLERGKQGPIGVLFLGDSIT